MDLISAFVDMAKAAESRRYTRASLRAAARTIGERVVTELRVGDTSALCRSAGPDDDPGHFRVVSVDCVTDDGMHEGSKVLAFVPRRSNRAQLLWLPDGAVRSAHGGYLEAGERGGLLELYPASDETRILFAKYLRSILLGFERTLEVEGKEMSKAADEMNGCDLSPNVTPKEVG